MAVVRMVQVAGDQVIRVVAMLSLLRTALLMDAPVRIWQRRYAG